MTNMPRKVAIVGGNRTPFARSNTAYRRASNQDLLTAALDGLIARFGLAGKRLGQVTAGAVMKHSRDFNLTRESVLATALDPATPGIDIQMACGTGLEAATTVANKIALGQIDAGVAGGSDTTSDAPIAVNEGLRRVLLDLGAAKTAAQRAKALAGLRPGHISPVLPATDEPRTGLSMGEHMARTALAFDVTRAEQDAIAAASHQKLAAAYERGFFDDLITPYLGLTQDNNLRPDSNAEKLAGLRTVFGDPETATMTAGNSTPLTDGASTVLLASTEWAEEHNLDPLAWFVDAETAAVDFVHGDEGLLMAPTHAVPRLLARHDLGLDDFDRVEIHEAFAATVACTLKAWESDTYCRDTLGLDGALGSIDPEKINVNGSSLAAGHPFAATGGRILAATAKELNELKQREGGTRRALISICAAGGQGVAAIVEA
ncbi:acetyl-CoA C-acetyltransferase [Propioniferax innocua]|uniref:Acetyl-CoA C-acetyltransferase n=1 Tax=Propioniferax innocua TaxID=1753 RepID=A0A542ZQS4_9ACTN|nr:acetyl-CoA C-acetyltransferase [Propioniferax innocua]TQL62677.1 acetyl-CoA C-acetyltransferase [Propioniferax innocua]